jgi:hypothetical protein
VISSVINEPEINEVIKLKIFEAISNHEIITLHLGLTKMPKSRSSSIYY